jgi:DNA-binding MarR family transcriptional regulator
MAQPETERAAGYLVKRVQQALRRRCDAALKPAGLSMSQYAVLRALSDHPKASAAELARLCFVTRQSLQDVLGGLRADGLVAPASQSAAGRVQSLQLTPRGRSRLEMSGVATSTVESVMTQGFSTKMRDELSKLLTLCAQNLEAETHR